MAKSRFYIGWFPPYRSNRADDYFVYAGVYRDTADGTLESIKKGEHMLSRHDYGILPIVFLFRHYMELQLKGLIILFGGEFEARSHNLSVHLKSLNELLKEKHVSISISQEAQDFINAIQSLDACSDGFRYPEKNPRVKRPKGEMYSTRNEPERFFQILPERDADTLKKVNTLDELDHIITLVTTELENVEHQYEYEKENWNEYLFGTNPEYYQGPES